MTYICKMFIFGLIVGLILGGVATAAFINNRYVVKRKINEKIDDWQGQDKQV